MIELTYLAYLTIAVGITFLVGGRLRRRGRAFLVDAFAGDESLGDSANQLSLVTFYLLNLAVIALLLRWGRHPQTALQTVEYLSTKLGVVLLVLGLLHSLKVRRIAALRRKALEINQEATS